MTLSSELKKRMAEVREEMDDISRQKAIINKNSCDINAELLIEKNGARRIALKEMKIENSRAQEDINARSAVLKTELQKLAMEEGMIFERNFLKVAKANLPTETYEKLVEQASQLSGIERKKK